MKHKGKKDNTNAARAQHNRRMRQEALREALAASGLVQQINQSEEKLLRIVASAMRVKSENLERLRVQIMALAKTLESRHKKLDKVLPSLKSQEGTLDVNLHDPAQTLEEAHQRARETRIRREQERAANGDSRSPESGSLH